MCFCALFTRNVSRNNEFRLLVILRSDLRIKLPGNRKPNAIFCSFHNLLIMRINDKRSMAEVTDDQLLEEPHLSIKSDGYSSSAGRSENHSLRHELKQLVRRFRSASAGFVESERPSSAAGIPGAKLRKKGARRKCPGVALSSTHPVVFRFLLLNILCFRFQFAKIPQISIARHP